MFSSSGRRRSRSVTWSYWFVTQFFMPGQSVSCLFNFSFFFGNEVFSSLLSLSLLLCLSLSTYNEICRRMVTKSNCFILFFLVCFMNDAPWYFRFIHFVLRFLFLSLSSHSILCPVFLTGSLSLPSPASLSPPCLVRVRCGSAAVVI